MTAFMAFKVGFYLALGGALGLVAACILVVGVALLLAAWYWADEMAEGDDGRR